MLVIALAALAFLAIARGFDLALRRLPRAFTISALAWIALCVTSLAWSADPAYTLSELQREVLYGGMAFIVLFSGTRSLRDARIAVFAILLGTLLMGAFEWVRHFAPAIRYAVKYEAAQGPFSTQIALVAPLLALAAWPAPGGLGLRPRTLALLAAALIAAGLATENRMLWLALAAGCVVAFAVFQAGASPDAHRARMLRVLLGTLALIALAIAASWEYKAARYYPKAATPVESISMDERPRVWSTAFALLHERPLLGHGYGREILGDRIERAVPPNGSVHIRHAHNVFIDVVLQLGFVGFAVFAALLGSLVHAYARVRHTAVGAPVAIAGIAMVATFIVKNLTDDFFFRPGSLTFWAVNGLLLALSLRTAKPAD